MPPQTPAILRSVILLVNFLFIITRSITDRKIAGVCGGIAEYFGIDSNLVRILWVLFALGGGSGLIVYILCALLIPEEPSW